MNILGGMKILWIFFWGHYKIGLDLGVIPMYFKAKELMVDILGGC